MPADRSVEALAGCGRSIIGRETANARDHLPEQRPIATTQGLQSQSAHQDGRREHGQHDPVQGVEGHGAACRDRRDDPWFLLQSQAQESRRAVEFCARQAM